jgi:predicted nucleic acid-binding protein
MWKIYLDTCCLNRPFDDRSQERVRREAEAVLTVLARLTTRDWHWISSEALWAEVEQMPDRDRRLRVRAMAEGAHQLVVIEQPQVERARALLGLHFKPLDALHLACAEAAGADVVLTTDDRLVRLARRVSGQLRLRVMILWPGLVRYRAHE